MHLAIIAAVSSNLVIGNEGCIPWYIPQDLKYFRKLTLGHVVVMGRKTYESLKKPLDNRIVIVVTNNPDYYTSNISVEFVRLEEVIAKLQNYPGKKVFIAGGAAIYTHFMSKASTLFLTRVEKTCNGDTIFPNFSEFTLKRTISKFYSDDEQCWVEFCEYEKEVLEVLA